MPRTAFAKLTYPASWDAIEDPAPWEEVVPGVWVSDIRDGLLSSVLGVSELPAEFVTWKATVVRAAAGWQVRLDIEDDGLRFHWEHGHPGAKLLEHLRSFSGTAPTAEDGKREVREVLLELYWTAWLPVRSAA